jgi:menaquinone-dependent protoporphyrinogen IX oxidase
MKIAIVYDGGSKMTGNAAEAMAEAFRQNGHICDVYSTRQVDPMKVRQADLICVGSPVKSLLFFFRTRPSDEIKEFLQKMPNLSLKKGVAFTTYLLWPGDGVAKLAGEMEHKGSFVVANFEFRGGTPTAAFEYFASKYK